MGIRQLLSGRAPGSAEIIKQVGGLFAPINKQKLRGGSTTDEGALSDGQDDISLDMSDEELLEQKTKWETDYEGYYGSIKTKQQQNVDYWRGRQYGWDKDMYQTVDNVIFESLETFLPIVTREAPTPVVLADNEEAGINLSRSVQKMLSYISDEEKLKTKLKSALRHWAMSYVGVMKVAYDFEENDIVLKVIDPTKLTLDSTGNHRYVGEKKQKSASDMINLFPDKGELIKELAKDKMGTMLGYTEWWTPTYTFWTIQKNVLFKTKNPNWNYDSVQQMMDEMGQVTEQPVKGSNHFAVPRIPYLFLNVFSLGRQPHDETSVIEQVIPLQDAVNKRTRQIDRNADDMNNGWVVSNQFTKDEAKNLADAIRRGGIARAPTPDIRGAIDRIQAAPLPQFIPNDLMDKRSEIMNVMGVRGSMAQGIMSERTVRGKIEIKGQDVDRVQLIVDYIEQFVDDIFNYMVQMMYVYYDQPHVAALIGDAKAAEYITIQKTDLNRKLIVSVKEGSMIPQDPLTQRNEAIDLWSAGAIDPITLFERLDEPDPKGMAERLFLWKQNPMALFGQDMQAMMQPQMAQQQPPQVQPQVQAPVPQDQQQPVPANPLPA